LSTTLEYDHIAKNYEKGRSDYPQESIEALAAALGLKEGKKILDLAAGTGKLSKVLKSYEIDLCAVEPSREMRAVYSELLQGVPIFEGHAESIPLPSESMDAVAVGTAFHWFEPKAALKEIARILKKGGGLALIWNMWDSRVQWIREIRGVLGLHEKGDVVEGVGWRELTSPDFSGEVFRTFEGNGLFTALSYEGFRYSLQGSEKEIQARLLTMLVSGKMTDAAQAEMAKEVAKVLARHPETRGKEVFDIPYRTDLFWCYRI